MSSTMSIRRRRYRLAYLHGAGSILDLGASSVELQPYQCVNLFYQSLERGAENDLREAWEEVGDSLSSSMQKLESELVSK